MTQTNKRRRKHKAGAKGTTERSASFYFPYGLEASLDRARDDGR